MLRFLIAELNYDHGGREAARGQRRDHTFTQREIKAAKAANMDLVHVERELRKAAYSMLLYMIRGGSD
ncbi:hypothetical protein ACIBKY_51305 [Nonomuraea sp. NPDC050394]|uniref:hypothetical protein n=1 Tax=Nonomuraea sp. NPDC050394 TaxID=3364363 RepID=UPI00379117DB